MSDPEDAHEGAGVPTDAAGSTTPANRSRQWNFSCRRRQRKPRKPPSNPPGWAAGKSTDYDLAKQPNRVVIINGEQV